MKAIDANCCSTTHSVLCPHSVLVCWLDCHSKRPLFVYTLLTLNLLTTSIVAPSSNASKWQMGFNSAFKGLKAVQLWNTSLTLNLLTTTIVAPSSNASKWQIGFHSAFKGLKDWLCQCTYRVCSPNLCAHLCAQSRCI